MSMPDLKRLMVLALTMLWLNAVYAETDVTSPSVSTSVSAEVINNKLKEVESSQDLDEETRTQITTLYKKSLTFLEEANVKKRAAAAFEQARKTASQEAIDIRKKLEADIKTKPEVSLEITDKTPLSEIEQLLITEKANQAAVSAKLAELEQKLVDETNRPVEARQQLTDAQQRQEALAKELALPPDTEELPLLSQAKRWALEAERLSLSARIRMLDQELLSQPMRIELLKAQRDKSRRDISRINTRVDMLEEIVNKRRHSEAEEAVAESEAARVEAAGKPPVLLAIAEENTGLSQVLFSLAATREYVTSQIDRVSAQANKIETEFRSAKKKLEIAGLGQVLGQLLQEQRQALPDLKQYRKEASVREKLNVSSVLRQIEFNEERSKLVDLNAEVNRLTANLDAAQVAAFRPELMELLARKRELLDKAIAADEAYLRSLGELDQAQRKLLDTAESYDNFLAERLLWIRSTDPVSRAELNKLPNDIFRVLSLSSWFETANILAKDALFSPLFLFAALLFAWLEWRRKRIRGLLGVIAAKLNRISTDRFLYTIQAMAVTVLLALPWPMLLAAIGWQLQQSMHDTDFSNAVGTVLLRLSIPLFSLRAFSMLCLPKGLAEAHFRWPEASLALLRKELRRLTLIAMIAGFTSMVSVRVAPITQGGALAIISFVVLLSALAFFLYQVLHPSKGAFHVHLQEHENTLLARLRYVWFPLVVGLPVLFAILAVDGYTYTASTLLNKMTSTLWLILGLVIIQQLALRWLLQIQRSYALKEALERREAAARAQAEGQQESQESAEARSALNDEGLLSVEEKIDMAALSEESRKLLNLALSIAGIAGLWLIWSSVLPAFSILESVELWHRSTMVSGVEKVVPVSLSDLGLTLLIVVVTILAAKRLPALFEIILLQRLHMTGGSRYAAKALASYVIAAVGVLYALQVIGFSWSKIQWLAAALTVGIGFGLQEIVANFISGLIILFERPIRVGDIVTIGDTDGVVTRIQIRATTIRNWDRKELLVPNKEFITSRLLNWSLSDPVTRIKVPVGVAYGSDVQKAMELMAEAAEENELIIDDPKHYVIFTLFGDNALNLELRAFVGSIDDRLPAITMLHKAINDKFNAAGIVISFPQRDVHLDTSRPLDIRLHHADKEIPVQGEPAGDSVR